MSRADRSAVPGRGPGLRFAVRGVVQVLLPEPSAWFHAVATLAVVAGGSLLGLSRIEWALLVLGITTVWTAEALNTAVEVLADAVSSKPHPLIARAKDVAAGGVLLAALGAVVVGLLVLGPPLLRAAGLQR